MSAAAPPPADDAGWVRVHPASPWVRGWTFLLLILFFAGRNAVEDFAAGRLSGEDAPGGGDGSLLVWREDVGPRAAPLAALTPGPLHDRSTRELLRRMVADVVARAEQRADGPVPG